MFYRVYLRKVLPKLSLASNKCTQRRSTAAKLMTQNIFVHFVPGWFGSGFFFLWFVGFWFLL